jgi:hypothetical protein
LIPTPRKIAIVLYSGNWDAVVPFVDTIKGINILNLRPNSALYIISNIVILGLPASSTLDFSSYFQEYYLLQLKEPLIKCLSPKGLRLLISLIMLFLVIMMGLSFNKVFSAQRK